MKKVDRKIIVMGIIWLVVCSCNAWSSVSAAVRLPKVIGDNMVLQCDKPLALWGWAEKGENVSVIFDGQTVATTTDEAGKWTVKLEPLKANAEPAQMVIEGTNKIVIVNILVGEVWLCSGQSNMEHSLKDVKNGYKEKMEAKYNEIRFFSVEKANSPEPLDDVQALWQECTPRTASSFSAVGYFFGRYLHRELDVPVGLIFSAYGGTLIEPWIPLVGYESVAELSDIANKVHNAKRDYNEQMAVKIDSVDQWVNDARVAIASAKPIPRLPSIPRHPLDYFQKPTVLYNSMIHGIVPFAIRGVIWY
ncbi:MAG: sialate O-acetylesterase, partial [bacterium]